MKNLILIFFCLGIITFNSCNPSKKITSELNTISFQADSNLQSQTSFTYKACNTRYFDLLHTKLEVNFNWMTSQLTGKATLRLHPYWYATNELTLNAQEFDIQEIALLNASEKKKLEYTYDRRLLKITLDKEYSRNDTIEIFIDYTANPEKIKTSGSDAITDRKGLYFINPKGEDPNKPTQLWTQGETEANSCWFPTIDSPNERMTQEIYITVDNKYATLSNGLLMYSKDNTDGTRTDYWKQSLPAAPYLTMMAVGNFSIVKDNWKDIEVNYYVEPEYEKYAKLIFGNTPEMLEFYSNKLGIEYPWEKYSQIVVRDYVSGAMENTTAVIHGEFLQTTDRKILDENHEDVIAHELFHHWFGDLVTCESWSNIPLNESFATYGEYLWVEYKYGKDEADHHIQQDLFTYLREAKEKRVPLIRYDYRDREDIFDSHSYQKGCRVLHMLRDHVGDEAFFKALHLYLTNNKFKSVEVDNLRMAFEEVSGEDLNWFFDQWFFKSGHPALTITYWYDDENKEETITVYQTQDTKKHPIFKLSLAVDIYANGKKERQHILIDQVQQSFTFPVSSKPDLVNVDANKMLLATKQDNKKPEEWIFQYYNAPLFMDRYEAVYILGELGLDSASEKVIVSALDDAYWYIRKLAIDYSMGINPKYDPELKAKLSTLAVTDSKAEVRASAIIKLQTLFPNDSSLMEVYKKGFYDKSYSVLGEALAGILMLDSAMGLDLTKKLEAENDVNNDVSIAYVYSNYSDSAYNAFFENAIKRSHNHSDKINLMVLYGNYLKKQNSSEILNSGVKILETYAKNETTWWVKLYGYYAISDIQILLEQKESLLTDQLSKLKKNKKAPSQDIATATAQLEKVTQQKIKLEEVLASIRNAETDERVKEYYGHEQ